jgi:cytochrome c-type biogenesis protein
MTQWFQQTAGSGALVVAIPVAVVAGLVSFFSPCVLPLLPGYLSYATGISASTVVSGQGDRRRMVTGAALFVLGFSVVFVALGVASASVAIWVFVNRQLLNTILGVLCVLFGLAFIGAIPLLQRDLRVHRVFAVGLGAAPLLGALFAFGWLPCVGPTLGAISTLAANEGSATRGGILLGFYSLGLGVPFIFAALAWRRMMVAVTWARRHHRAINLVGGTLMVAIGVLLIFGWYDYAVQWIQIHLVSDTQPSI